MRTKTNAELERTLKELLPSWLNATESDKPLDKERETQMRELLRKYDTRELIGALVKKAVGEIDSVEAMKWPDWYERSELHELDYIRRTNSDSLPSLRASLVRAFDNYRKTDDLQHILELKDIAYRLYLTHRQSAPFAKRVHNFEKGKLSSDYPDQAPYSLLLTDAANRLALGHPEWKRFANANRRFMNRVRPENMYIEQKDMDVLKKLYNVNNEDEEHQVVMDIHPTDEGHRVVPRLILAHRTGRRLAPNTADIYRVRGKAMLHTHPKYSYAPGPSEPDLECAAIEGKSFVITPAEHAVERTTGKKIREPVEKAPANPMKHQLWFYTPKASYPIRIKA